VRLDALPVDGAWLRPTKDLREAAGSFLARRV
ncbi:NYN domain-containing protein, partial [Modestobacter roseus]|nr:NYN domain-containing protein [Modestobacter roseus]